MKKENRKKVVKKITVQDVTKKIFELCAATEPYQHPTKGKILSASQIKSLCPSFGPYFKNVNRIEGLEMIKIYEEEATALNIKNSGNPKLGIRMFTETGCEKIGERMPEKEQRNYFMIIRCLFHKEEVRNLLYPSKQPEPEEQLASAKHAEPAEKENEILIQFGKLILCQMDALKEQTVELKRIADSMSAIQDMLANMQAVPEVLPDRVISDPPVKEEDLESPVTSLKLKRGEKDPVYKKKPDMIQKYKEEVLEGVPAAMHNSVLNYAYRRMRDVYGVPIDTYKNEYFADTGKAIRSSLDIAHWLEFRNPAIRGLLRCCVQAVMQEEFQLKGEMVQV